MSSLDCPIYRAPDGMHGLVVLDDKTVAWLLEDFLFPRRLQSSYRPSQIVLYPKTPVDVGRPLFPPVRHLTFHIPDTGKPQCMPSVNLSTGHALPSADRLQQLQLTKLPAGMDGHFQTTFRNPPRQLSATNRQMGLQARDRLLPQAQRWRSRSNSTHDSSGGYSCFQVVKPYQAGHYIIHPEFVSECLR